jgi:polysaccharide transporter, PST family
MTLIKTSILSAISTVIRIVSGFIITKVIAVYVGPSGLAVIGQLQNFIALILNISGNALSTAITKYTAEYEKDESKKYRLWSASFKIVLPISIFISIAIFIFSNQFSNYLFQSEEFGYVLKVFAVTIPIFLINSLFMAILNGHRDIKKYIMLNIVSSIVSLIFVSLLVIYFALDGALLAYVLGQSIVLIVTLFYIKKEPWLKIKNFMVTFQSDEVKKLFGFAVITFTSVSASSIMMLVTRDYLTQNFSVESAGYWQGIWSLSQVSLSLITMSLSTYLLPTLSGLKNSKQISNELQKAYLLMIPCSYSYFTFGLCVKRTYYSYTFH